jgi:hypothetical protein
MIPGNRRKKLTIVYQNKTGRGKESDGRNVP